MAESQGQQIPKIYNIKGLSWMLKTSSSASTPCSSTSTNMDQHFKIFKLKDQKKKWKKKINKKFQSVGEQIENVIRRKYTLQQPYDISSNKNEDLKHTPHLRQGKNFFITNRYSSFEQSRINKINSHSNFNSKKSPVKRSSQKENSLHFRTDSKSKQIDQYEFQKKVILLSKVFGEIKNENSKVKKSKNIMRIHSQQKEYLDKHNQQFFKRQHEWIDNKVQFYNDFDIKRYEKDLIQKMCKKDN